MSFRKPCLNLIFSRDVIGSFRVFYMFDVRIPSGGLSDDFSPTRSFS